MTENLLDPQTTQSTEIQGYFEKLVGEGRKFKDGDTLAKAKEDSDLYVKTLERQKDELRADNLKMREQIVTKANLEELIAQLEAKQKQSPAITPNANDANIQKPTFDPNELKTLVRDELKTIGLTERQEQNFNLVKNKLIEKFGDNFQASLKQHTEVLGMTDEQVNRMARETPQALLRAIGVDAPTTSPTFQAPPRSGVRNDSFTPSVQQDHTWSWWQNLKKTDYKTYSDPKSQVQMHNDAIRLGERFKDGDYNAFD